MTYKCVSRRHFHGFFRSTVDELNTVGIFCTFVGSNLYVLTRGPLPARWNCIASIRSRSASSLVIFMFVIAEMSTNKLSFKRNCNYQKDLQSLNPCTNGFCLIGIFSGAWMIALSILKNSLTAGILRKPT